MISENELPDLESWLGRTKTIRDTLRGIEPGFVPDPSFRDWPDTLATPEGENQLSNEALAYSHSFLRNDVNLLVLLALNHLGRAHAYEIVNFLRQQDLGTQIGLDRIQVAPILRELVGCNYSGVYKEDDTASQSRFEQLPSVEGLVSMAGYLYAFSREQDKPLSDFLGIARGNHVRTDSTFFQGENISNAMDRILIVGDLKERWEMADHTFNFETNLGQVGSKTGIRGTILEPQFKDLSGKNFLQFETTSPHEGPRQEYRWNKNGRKKKHWNENHSAFAHYLHEYVMLHQRHLSRVKAIEYLRSTYPDVFNDVNPAELDRRVEYSLNGLLARGFIRSDTPFVNGAQSSITFPVGTTPRQLIEYGVTLDKIRSQEPEAIDKGLALAREISVDREGITRLLRKSGK